VATKARDTADVVEDVNVALGSKLDTTAYTAPGLVLITSQSFTSASSLVFNNVFSATYIAYRIVYFFTSDANVTTDVRMRVGGTTTSGGTDYAWSRVFISGTSNTTNNGGSTGASSGVFANATDNARGIAGAWDVIRPFAAAATSWSGLATYTGLGEWGFIVHGAATSYDGFEITGGGSKTGTIKVYGYKD
jgi:hypothetical protein